MKKITIILVCLGALAVGLISLLIVLGLKGPKTNFSFEEALRRDIKQEVSATGKIKPAQMVDLSFEAGGKVAQINHKVGEQIESKTILATLQTSELEATLSQYQSDWQAQKAILSEMMAGTRPEEIAIAQTKINNGSTTLKDAVINLTNVESKSATDLANIYDDTNEILQTSLTKTDDALNKQIDTLFSNDTTNNPLLTFETANSQAKTESQTQRYKAQIALSNINFIFNRLGKSNEEKDQALFAVEAELIIIRNFLNTLSAAVNEAAGDETAINTYKGYVNTARTNINNELGSVNNQKQAISTQKALSQTNISTAKASVNTAQSNLNIAIDELALKLAGSSQEQINSQAAKVNSALANIQNIKAKIQKNTLYSPIAGTITKIEIETGEIVGANQPAVSIISNSAFEIETFVPEIDVVKVKINDQAKITIDALGDGIVFSALVSQVDPAETMVEGVATYKTILQFLSQDETIKSGLTANIDILTASKKGVLAVPSRAIISQENNNKIIKVLAANGDVIEKKVATGLRGSDGYTEILSGISEGDKVITSF